MSLQGLYWFKCHLHFAAIMAKKKSSEVPKSTAKSKVKDKAKAKAKATRQLG